MTVAAQAVAVVVAAAVVDEEVEAVVFGMT